jgi:hypothetical protein
MISTFNLSVYQAPLYDIATKLEICFSQAKLLLCSEQN